MKLEYGAVTLFDHADSDGSAISGLSGSMGRLVDVSEPQDAESIATYFRNVRRTELRFTISKPNASADTALAAWFELDASLLGNQQLTITSGTTVVQISGNLRSVGLARIIGSRIEYDFDFLGGKPTITSSGAVSTGLFAYQTLAPNAAGTTAISLGSEWRRNLRIVPVGGSVDFTHNLTLGTSGVSAGKEIAVRLMMPASTHPKLYFYNASTGGTNLLTELGLAEDYIRGLAGAVNYRLEFVFTGTAWQLESFRSE